MGKRTWEAAVEILRETDSQAIMWGDEGLGHMIAERAGLGVQGRAIWTTEAVLRNLSRSPGDLIPGFVRNCQGRLVRIFFLPEHAPESLRG